MHFPVIAGATNEAFVEYWSDRYVDPHEELYAANIGGVLTADCVNSLFEWKNGGTLSRAKSASIEKHYIRRLPELAGLPQSTTAEEFLGLFGGGPIWRIFALHCWRPDRYPIYDQHVHRSMEYILAQRTREIPGRAKEILASYCKRYLPFWGTFPMRPNRLVDKALWTFGKFLKAFPDRAVGA